MRFTETWTLYKCKGVIKEYLLEIAPMTGRSKCPQHGAARLRLLCFSSKECIHPNGWEGKHTPFQTKDHKPRIKISENFSNFVIFFFFCSFFFSSRNFSQHLYKNASFPFLENGSKTSKFGGCWHIPFSKNVNIWETSVLANLQLMLAKPVRFHRINTWRKLVMFLTPSLNFVSYELVMNWRVKVWIKRR